MTDRIAIQPAGPIHGRIRPPGSKSITNRALVCAALAEGESRLRGALDSDDTQYMLAGLNRLGVATDFDVGRHEICVTGCGGILPAEEANLFVGNSGTTLRFLTAAASLGHGTYRLDGVDRMRERPIQDLLDALSQWGVSAESELGTGAPPVVIRARGIQGGLAHVAGNISSQYLSGLLMAAPYARSDVRLEIRGELVSRPYVEMTLRVMESFGVHVERTGDLFSIAAGQIYQSPGLFDRTRRLGRQLLLGGAAAITGGSVTVEGLGANSLQGDVAFCDCLQAMGCSVEMSASEATVRGQSLRGVQVDMNGISDTVQTLAAVALFAEGPTEIRGVAHIRHKETDRIADLARELRKVGAHVDEAPDGLRIEPGPLHPATLDTYDDHRMAMSLALIGLRQPGIVIRDPACTAKTYPRFFDDLTRLCH